MRVHKNLWVVFVRLKTGSTVVHAASGDYRVARYHFREAEKRKDIDQISIEMFMRNPPLGSKAVTIRERLERLKAKR